jgi:4'-phosphopantetheinyl transferase
MDVYWLEQSEADVPKGGEWLSEEDESRLKAMRFHKRRADSRLGKWTAKCALGIHLNVNALASIEIRASQCGAPTAFVANKAADATISLSHRAGVALCAIAPFGVALGCDLELIEPHSNAFLADYFTDDEQAFISSRSLEDRPWLLTLLWSAKESALKALGEGLRLDTRSVVVSLSSCAFNPSGCIDDWLPLQVRYLESRCFNGWWRHTGKFLHTLVADPSPASPSRLRMRSGH